MQRKIKVDERGKNTYCRNEKGHEASIVELIIVMLIRNSCSIGNAIPPQLVLNVCHGKRGKYKHQRVHQNLWDILTHQLATYPLRQVEYPQANTFEGLGDPIRGRLAYGLHMTSDNT